MNWRTAACSSSTCSQCPASAAANQAGGEAAEAGAITGELHLRRCLGITDQAVCEWLPQGVSGGIYYALVDETTSGLLPNGADTTRLEPVLVQPTPEAQPAPTPEPGPTPEPKDQGPDNPLPEPGAPAERAQWPRPALSGDRPDQAVR